MSRFFVIAPSFACFLRSLGFAALALAILAASAQASTARIRVEGEGYLRFSKEGRAVYAKAADLVLASGELKEKSGVSLLPPVQVPGSATSFRVDEQGWIWTRSATGESKVARLLLARFEHGSGLESEGAFLISRERASLGFAGVDGLGTIATAPPTAGAAIPAGPPEVQRAVKSTSGLLVVTVPSSATVEGPKMTLGEIAQVAGPDAERVAAIDLGTTPVHGIPLSYSRERILNKILLLRIDRDKVDLRMDAVVEIRRSGQTVKPEELLEKAKSAVQEKVGLKGELDCSDRLADIHVPNGSLEIVAETVTTINGSATVTLGIRVDGKRVIGRTLRITGAILEPAVQAGSSVTVRFLSNGVSIELPGRVRASAAIGQSVEVTVNTGTGSATTTHVGTVVATGKVEVKL